jgi:putative glycosyltransferase (TIGR04348 family)
VKIPTLVIVTPALAKANNGNWQTARRWAQMLRGHYRVRMVGEWTGSAAADRQDDLMIALHARRSASSVAAWHAQPGDKPLVLVLTGTDLYRDISTDALAQRSLALAHRLVVLNELGLQSLPAEHRSKGLVCLQSTPARLPLLNKPGRHLRALMVGHLREEKSPQTYFEAARLLAQRSDIWLDHIGGALDPVLAEEARSLMAVQPRYRWLGGLAHAATRARIQAAHVLVHASRMEGGAHVVTEAITSGTPVLASRIDGNLGLLGRNYAGIFDWGDAPGLAALLQRCRDDAAMLPRLLLQCQKRAPLFDPVREQQTLLKLLAPLAAPPKPIQGPHERPRKSS